MTATDRYRDVHRGIQLIKESAMVSSDVKTYVQMYQNRHITHSRRLTGKSSFSHKYIHTGKQTDGRTGVDLH